MKKAIPPDSEPFRMPPDLLNASIGVLTRREVEARLLGPIIDDFSRRFGHEETLEVLNETIVRIGREQGKQLARTMGGNSLGHFAESLQYWTQDHALELEILEKTEVTFSFHVTRCRYAELYRSLGLGGLGTTFSCNRDFALIEGFNPRISLHRTGTIMEGATVCDFRYFLGKTTRGSLKNQ